MLDKLFNTLKTQHFLLKPDGVVTITNIILLKTNVEKITLNAGTSNI